MFWWVTVPIPMFGSHIETARPSRRVGSRYRYCFVSAATLPGRRAEHRDVREQREAEVAERGADARRRSATRRRASATSASVLTGVLTRTGGAAPRPRGPRACRAPSRPSELARRARSAAAPSRSRNCVVGEHAIERGGEARRRRRRAARCRRRAPRRRGPAMRVATAGVPHAAASVSVIPHPSCADALATTHARRYRSIELVVGDPAREMRSTARRRSRGAASRAPRARSPRRR